MLSSFFGHLHFFKLSYFLIFISSWLIKPNQIWTCQPELCTAPIIIVDKWIQGVTSQLSRKKLSCLHLVPCPHCFFILSSRCPRLIVTLSFPCLHLCSHFRNFVLHCSHLVFTLSYPCPYLALTLSLPKLVLASIFPKCFASSDSFQVQLTLIHFHVQSAKPLQTAAVGTIRNKKFITGGTDYLLPPNRG